MKEVKMPRRATTRNGGEDESHSKGNKRQRNSQETSDKNKGQKVHKRTRSRSIETDARGNQSPLATQNKQSKKQISQTQTPKGDKRTVICQSSQQDNCPNNFDDSMQSSFEQIVEQDNLSADPVTETEKDIIELRVDVNQDEFFSEVEDGELCEQSKKVDCPVDYDQQPGCSYQSQHNEADDHTFATEEVDSEVNFRIRRPRLRCNDNQNSNYSVRSNQFSCNQVPDFPPTFMQEFEDPRIERSIQQVIDRRWKAKEKELEQNMSKSAHAKSPGQSKQLNACQRDTYASEVIQEFTPVRSGLRNDKGTPNKGRIKSPSDTTLYTPGLRKLPEKEVPIDNNKAVIDQISDFVDNIRVSQKINEVAARPNSSQRISMSTPKKKQMEVETEDARNIADRMVLEAERFKASIAPPGNENLYLNRQQAFAGVTNDRNTLLDDDKFFHITCHVDPVLCAKIERGKFVELEKLLSHDKFQGRVDEGRLEFYNHDGYTYLVPANKETKISNVRKWEQAFRVYAAIYSKANPSRAAEIWQYVYVINTAASAYVWENVSFYDYTFRQMMVVNPQHSWSKIFNLMWNLAMHEPIGNQRTGQGYTQDNRISGGGGKGFGKKRRKSDACWRFNRNEICHPPCNFQHKCSYCGQCNHSVLDCPKLKNKKPQDHHNSNSNSGHSANTHRAGATGNHADGKKD